MTSVPSYCQPARRTPHTNLVWRGLNGWLATTAILRRRCVAKATAATYAACAAHWRVLTVDEIDAADETNLVAFVLLLKLPLSSSNPWGAPPRGRRRATLWELRNVRARNRIMRLARERHDFGASQRARLP